MSESNNGFGSGILKGLKHILFNDSSDQTQQAPDPAPTAVNQPVQPAETVPAVTSWPSANDGNKEMKLKVYQLLENMNKPGIDFFEVWNASTEMGGTTAPNIKAAFTSLRFADKSLTKDKLLETGAYYMTNLQNVLQTETQKRVEEKSSISKEKEQLAGSLATEIKSIEQQIAGLQQTLTTKKQDHDTINDKYEPKLTDIDNRIRGGQQSVNSVLADMQQVIDIIKKEIN